jgi:hypothetical protein
MSKTKNKKKKKASQAQSQGQKESKKRISRFGDINQVKIDLPVAYAPEYEGPAYSMGDG